MRVLVTGARGQVGTELTTALQNLEYVTAVLATSRESLDFTVRQSVFDCVKDFSPSVIFHCGAMTNVDLCEDDTDRAFLVNGIGTRFVKQAARAASAKVIYLSSDYVFDGKANKPINEWSPTGPISVYGASKLAGEQELESCDIIVRTSWVMGVYGKNILKTILRLANGSGEVKFVNDQLGSPTVVSDLVTVLIQLMENDESGTFHVSNSGSVSWYELTRFVFEVTGHDPARVLPIRSFELDASRKAPRPGYSVLDNAALRLSGYPTMPDWRTSVESLCAELSKSPL